MRSFFLTLFLPIISTSLPAQNKPEAPAMLISKFITLEGYNRWMEGGNYKLGYFPEIIKNRTNLAFNLGDRTVAAATFYPYLEFVCSEAAKNSKSKSQLLLEASAWYQSDLGDMIKTDRSGLIITAEVVFLFLIPDMHKQFADGALAATLAERVEFAKKIERLY